MVKDRTLSKFNFTMEAFLIRVNLFKGAVTNQENKKKP